MFVIVKARYFIVFLTIQNQKKAKKTSLTFLRHSLTKFDTKFNNTSWSVTSVGDPRNFENNFFLKYVTIVT